MTRKYSLVIEGDSAGTARTSLNLPRFSWPEQP